MRARVEGSSSGLYFPSVHYDQYTVQTLIHNFRAIEISGVCLQALIFKLSLYQLEPLAKNCLGCVRMCAHMCLYEWIHSA